MLKLVFQFFEFKQSLENMFYNFFVFFKSFLLFFKWKQHIFYMEALFNNVRN